eukprot:TRINITY_DN6342_c0_g1_i1.p1 TRINITY_DN6342_c0_g1~~TRINITY_DN6342_c0_g1_i1.p1  ORF type:complete len:604 (+),score=94.26 TRINITY_DN6342_c0_g1_i1:1578-3389(+)
MEEIREYAIQSSIYSGIDVVKGVMTKERFQSEIDKQTDLSGGLVWCSSGGMATGKKYYLPVDRREWEQEYETNRELAKTLEMFNSRQVVLNLLSGTGYPTFDTIGRILSDCGATAAPCDGRCADDYIFRIYRRFKANTLLTTTNRLFQLSWFLQREGATMPMKQIILYGNIPSPEQLHLCLPQFSVAEHGKNFPPNISSIFGTSELGIIAYSPHQLRDLAQFLLSPNVVVESKDCCPGEVAPSSMEKYVEVYENQRHYPMIGWKNKLMKKDPAQFTTIDMKPMRRSEVKLPDVEEHGVWGFSGKWEASKRWLYSWEWTGPWMAEDELLACGSPNGGKREKPKKRRRQWKVKMVRTQSPEERGSGRLLVSSKHRKKIPYIRYDMGDIGRISDCVFQGDQYKSLRLTARQHQTFRLGECVIFLSEIEPLLTEYLDFQLQHELRDDDGGLKDIIVVKLLLPGRPGQKSRPCTELDAETKKRLSMSIRDVIQSPRQRDSLPEYHIEVMSVPPSEFKICDTNGKLRRLVDTRGNAGVPDIVMDVQKVQHDGKQQKLAFKPPSVDDGMSGYAPSVAPSCIHSSSSDRDDALSHCDTISRTRSDGTHLGV